MNKEIRDATSITLKLAKEYGGFGLGEEFVVSFYKAAFNAGIFFPDKWMMH